MTDQEFDRELETLMSDGASGQAEITGQPGRILGRSIKRIKKKRLAAGAVLAALAILFLSTRGGRDTAIPVTTAPLERDDVQELLSISGPISGTDSAEVVSRLHARILEILVSEGDRVRAGDVLARLDTVEVQREVDAAQNAYDLAVANLADAQRDAELGYAGAQQELTAARLDLERKTLLYQNGDISQVDMETVQNAVQDAQRKVQSYTLDGGKPVAAESYRLQVEQARLELEKKQEELKDAEVTSPIDGTVVRVNSRVGRFADVVDDDKPLFAIDDLQHLEMKISVSEYSIGKVKLGQKAEITADILGGDKAYGEITAISPTGEEKGGGSSERVIPTTIRIDEAEKRLIAGITARARIVLNEATDVWVVPDSALLRKDEGCELAVAEEGRLRLIPVETGVEGEINTEVRSEELKEGMEYILSPDLSWTDGMEVAAVSAVVEKR